MIEREVKLAVPSTFQLPDLEQLAADLHPSSTDERRLDTIYYDTPDLRLVRWGCSLRLRQGEGWTLKLPTTSRGPTLSRRELEFPNPESRPPDAAISLVLAYVRRSPLVPVVSLSTVRRRTELRHGDGRVIAEVVDDDVSVIQALRVQNRFREVEVELRDPSADSLVQPILARLRQAGAADEGNMTKLVRALGARATAAPEVHPTAVSSAASAGDVVRLVIATSVASLMRHDPGVRLGDDVEDVHRARVATRRLRSQLRTLEPLLDSSWSKPLRDELRWLADGLGSVRDKQVLSQRLRRRAATLPPADAAAVAELADELWGESEEARARLALDMRTDRYLDLVERLVEAARAPVLRTDAQQPASTLLPSLVRSDWRRLRRGMARLPGMPADTELHRIRILAKRLRYGSEAAAPVIGKPATALADAATGLQDVLGDHQDSVTARAWLREKATAGQGAFVAGELWMLERRAADEDRDAFPEIWKKIRRKRLRKWMI